MDQNIFSYDDGQGTTLYADPLELHYTFTRLLDGDPSGAMLQAKSENNLLALHAIGRIIAAAREVFHFQPIDRTTGKGTSTQHVYHVLGQLQAFLEKKNPSTDAPPISPPPTASEPSWEPQVLPTI